MGVYFVTRSVTAQQLRLLQYFPMERGRPRQTTVCCNSAVASPVDPLVPSPLSNSRLRPSLNATLPSGLSSFPPGSGRVVPCGKDTAYDFRLEEYGESVDTRLDSFGVSNPKGGGAATASHGKHTQRTTVPTDPTTRASWNELWP